MKCQYCGCIYWGKKRKWYTHRTATTAKKLKLLYNFIYAEKTSEQTLHFITITTCQHKNGMSDQELHAALRKWLKNRQIEYVFTVERQTKGFKGNQPSEDLHYHILTVGTQKRYDFEMELSKLGRLFKVQPHPALLDIKRINTISTLISYVSKYVTKQSQKCSSIYTSRTLGVSKRLWRRYKENADKYVIKLSGDNLINFIKEVRQNRLLTKSKGFERVEIQPHNKYFAIYRYYDDIWNVATRYKPNHLLITEGKN